MTIKWKNLLILALSVTVAVLLLRGGPDRADPLLPLRDLLNSPSHDDRAFGLALLCALLIAVVALTKLALRPAGQGRPEGRR